MGSIEEKNFLPKFSSQSSRRLTIAGVSFLLVIILVVSATVLSARFYQNRALPGLHIGGVGIGGMTESTLRSFLATMNDKLGMEGITITVKKEEGEKRFVIYPVRAAEGDSVVLLDLDIDKEVERLLRYGKGRGIFRDAWVIVKSGVQEPHTALEHIAADRARLITELQSRVQGEGRAPQNAAMVVTSVHPLEYHIGPARPGVVFDYDGAVDQIVREWSRLAFPKVDMAEEAAAPAIGDRDLEHIVSRIPAIFSGGDITLAYTDPRTAFGSRWVIPLVKIGEWLEAQKTPDHGIGFGLAKAPVTDYLTRVVAPAVNVASQDAKFRVDETTGSVIEFRASRQGVVLDIGKTYELVNRAILDRTWNDEGTAKAVALAVSVVEPAITTGEVNNLGITEILGAGVSNFAGSPKNRALNIKNAVGKLNGVLIKPDEEFSALERLRPFTADGGYLPELVIKGDEIKPEVGGGLCQIGTTLFRMAMNSGMPITARRNHSLVVNYYNDPGNGAPGTDATVYDPAPDFKFKNDTGNYLLIQTEMNQKIGQLVFTLWGTSDGRNGLYTKPKVSKWYPYGETKIVETTKLKPGEKQCQHPFKGADASFTYIRELPDGKKEEKVYTSHYRPLPEICLVGVESLSGNASSTDALPLVAE